MTLLEDTKSPYLREHWTARSSSLGEFLDSHKIPFQDTTIWLTVGRRRFVLFDAAVLEFYGYYGKFSVVTDVELLFQVRHIAATLHCERVK